MSFRVLAGLRLLLLPALLAALPGPVTPAEPSRTRTRTFRFTYAATVTGLKPGRRARVWLPVPTSGEDQEVRIVSRDLPAEGKIHHQRQYGNKVLYLEARADAEGKVPLKMVYRVKRREAHATLKKEDTEDVERYLRPDARVPIDGKPLELLKGKELPGDELKKARALYDLVNGHMRYSKEGTGWGRGDSVWACEAGRGNCTDFHSLFISLARSQKLPAKFVIGFPLPARRGRGTVEGYHCWAWFRTADRGWFPVDVSEANKDPKLRDYYFGHLSENRVAFSTGRDLTLEPKQAGLPLNYFVYPYVEVGGKPYPLEKIERRFSYRDE